MSIRLPTAIQAWPATLTLVIEPGLPVKLLKSATLKSALTATKFVLLEGL